MQDDRLLTAEDVAELLAVPIGWVREHTRNGNLPCVPLGRYRRYRRDAVLAFVAEQEGRWRKHHPEVARA